MTAFDSQWSRRDRAMVEVLPTVVPPGGVHAVLGKAPATDPVFLTNWPTLRPTMCDVTARVLLPRRFDPNGPDACPLCVEMVTGVTASVRR